MADINLEHKKAQLKFLLRVQKKEFQQLTIMADGNIYMQVDKNKRAEWGEFLAKFNVKNSKGRAKFSGPYDDFTSGDLEVSEAKGNQYGFILKPNNISALVRGLKIEAAFQTPPGIVISRRGGGVVTGFEEDSFAIQPEAVQAIYNFAAMQGKPLLLDEDGRKRLQHALKELTGLSNIEVEYNDYYGYVVKPCAAINKLMATEEFGKFLNESISLEQETIRVRRKFALRGIGAGDLKVEKVSCPVSFAVDAGELKDLGITVPAIKGNVISFPNEEEADSFIDKYKAAIVEKKSAAEKKEKIVKMFTEPYKGVVGRGASISVSAPEGSQYISQQMTAEIYNFALLSGVPALLHDDGRIRLRHLLAHISGVKATDIKVEYAGHNGYVVTPSTVMASLVGKQDFLDFMIASNLPDHIPGVRYAVRRKFEIRLPPRFKAKATSVKFAEADDAPEVKEFSFEPKIPPEGKAGIITAKVAAEQGGVPGRRELTRKVELDKDGNISRVWDIKSSPEKWIAMEHAGHIDKVLAANSKVLNNIINRPGFNPGVAFVPDDFIAVTSGVDISYNVEPNPERVKAYRKLSPQARSDFQHKGIIPLGLQSCLTQEEYSKLMNNPNYSDEKWIYFFYPNINYQQLETLKAELAKGIEKSFLLAAEHTGEVPPKPGVTTPPPLVFEGVDAAQGVKGNGRGFVMVAGQVNGHEAPGASDYSQGSNKYQNDHTQGPKNNQDCLKAGLANLGDKKFCAYGDDFPNIYKGMPDSERKKAASEALKVGGYVKNGYLIIIDAAKFFDEKNPKSGIKLIEKNLRLKCNEAESLGTGDKFTQVLCAAPPFSTYGDAHGLNRDMSSDFAGVSAPPKAVNDSIDAKQKERLQELTIVRQYEIMARAAVARADATGELVPLEFTCLGSGAFNNGYGQVEKGLKAAQEIVKGHNVQIIAQGYKPDEAAKMAAVLGTSIQKAEKYKKINFKQSAAAPPTKHSSNPPPEIETKKPRKKIVRKRTYEVREDEDRKLATKKSMKERAEKMSTSSKLAAAVPSRPSSSDANEKVEVDMPKSVFFAREIAEDEMLPLGTTVSYSGTVEDFSQELTEKLNHIEEAYVVKPSTEVDAGFEVERVEDSRVIFTAEEKEGILELKGDATAALDQYLIMQQMIAVYKDEEDPEEPLVYNLPEIIATGPQANANAVAAMLVAALEAKVEVRSDDDKPMSKTEIKQLLTTHLLPMKAGIEKSDHSALKEAVGDIDKFLEDNPPVAPEAKKGPSARK